MLPWFEEVRFMGETYLLDQLCIRKINLLMVFVYVVKYT